MIKHFCDRCGEHISDLDERIFVELRDNSECVPLDVEDRYEICHDCFDKLMQLIGGSDAT